MTNVIGGELIWGGWVVMFDRAAGFPYGTDGNLYRQIPIRNCRDAQLIKEKQLAMSGLLGVPTSRRTAVGYRFSFEIWFDVSNPIELSLPGDDPIPSLRQRDPFQLYFILGDTFSSDAGPQSGKFRYLPRCVAEHIEDIWDEESDPRKCIGQRISGRSKGMSFLLPDDGDPTDDTTMVGAYMAYLAARGDTLL